MSTENYLLQFEPTARSIGDILRSATALYYQYFVVLAGSSLLFVALPSSIQTVALESTSSIDTSLLAAFLVNQLIIAVSLLFEIVVVVACSLHLFGAKPTFLQTIKQLSPALVLRVVGTYIVMEILLFFLMLALIVPAVIYGIRWALSTVVVVLERRVYRDALRRSRQLMEGEWWRYFAMMSPILVLGGIAGAILFFYEDAIFSKTFTSIGISVLLALISPMFSVASVLFYYDIRIRKEGLTLDAIRELIGLSGGPREWSLQWDLPVRADRLPTVPD